MPTDGKVPGYVQIVYHSSYASHIMQLKTRVPTTTGINDPGTYETWAGGVIAGDVMAEQMIDALGAYVPATITFDSYTLFRQATVLDAPQPFFTKAYSVIGSAVGITGQDKAVQVTLGFKTELFGNAFIVVLDRPSNGFFGSNVIPGGVNAAVIAEFENSLSAWAGMDNSRPAAYTNTSISLNKRLRRKYGMI